MQQFEIRPFRRSDRDQVAALVNSHIAAVIPGMSVSINAVLSQFEREPGEAIVDPWVSERVTLVAEQRERIVAAAHLLRYADEERVGPSYRNAGEIRWFLYRPLAPVDNPFWPDATAAAERLLAATLSQLATWGVERRYADGAVPAPGVYGVPEQWPHIQAAYRRAGFAWTGSTETVFLARIRELPGPAGPPLEGLTIERSVGLVGTRLSALNGGDIVGYIEVETMTATHHGWADIGNLHVAEPFRRRRVGTWLLGQAAEWLRLAGVERVLDYTSAGEEAYEAFLRASGFRVLTRTLRGWEWQPGPEPPALD